MVSLLCDYIKDWWKCMSILSYLSNYNVSSWYLQALRFLKNLIIEPINTFKYAINHLDMKRKKDLDAQSAFEDAA